MERRPSRGGRPLCENIKVGSLRPDYFSEKRSSSKALSITSLGRAPTTALGCSPGSKRAMVGMLEMPKAPASSDSASTSTLATFRVPSYSAAIWSITGATWRHGAHHEAQKSTNTGTSDLRTSSSKVCAVIATGSAMSNLLFGYQPIAQYTYSPGATCDAP